MNMSQWFDASFPAQYLSQRLLALEMDELDALVTSRAYTQPAIDLMHQIPSINTYMSQGYMPDAWLFYNSPECFYEISDLKCIENMVVDDISISMIREQFTRSNIDIKPLLATNVCSQPMTKHPIFLLCEHQLCDVLEINRVYFSQDQLSRVGNAGFYSDPKVAFLLDVANYLLTDSNNHHIDPVLMRLNHTSTFPMSMKRLLALESFDYNAPDLVTRMHHVKDLLPSLSGYDYNACIIRNMWVIASRLGVALYRFKLLMILLLNPEKLFIRDLPKMRFSSVLESQCLSKHTHITPLALEYGAGYLDQSSSITLFTSHLDLLGVR